MWRRPLLLLGAGLVGFLYTSYMVTLPVGEGEGRARLHIERILPSGKGWLYQGRLKSFEGETVGRGLPIRWKTAERLEGSTDYWADGRLVKRGGYRLVKGRGWEPIAGSHSFAERRYQTRVRVERYLSRHLSAESAPFLRALICGDLLDPQTLLDFSRLGLIHLMVISGFHFSLIAGMLGLIMRPKVPYKLAAILLLWILSFYFGFLGCSPAVVRAFVMAAMGLVALLIERQNFAMNALGVSLVIVLLIDPCALFSAGFAFSFLCTGAILTFYRPVERLLRPLIPPFKSPEVWKMPLLDQHGYLFATWIRRGLALGISVNTAALPLTLFYFHQFPWLGLLCNLFFPALIALMLFLLPFAALCPLLFWIEEGLIRAATGFTHYLPPFFDFRWVVVDFPLELLLGILALLLLLLLKKNQRIVKRGL